MKNYNYLISCEDSFNQSEYNIIFSLYQPIIGPVAASLYFTLINEGKNSKTKFSGIKLELERLLKICDLDEASFDLASKQLESVQLLKRFINKKDQIIKFEIFKPLSGDQFLNNELYKTLLLKKVDQEVLESFELLFVKTSKLIDDEFEDISSTLFEIHHDELSDLKENILTKECSKPITKHSFFGVHLNTNKITSILSREGYELNINTEEYLPFLKFVASSKRIKSKDMANMIIKHYDQTTQIFNGLNFVNDAPIQKRYYFDDINKQFKHTKDYNVQSFVFFQELTGREIDQLGRNLIDKLHKEFSFKDNIINLLMEYSAQKNNDEVINNYISKIAQTIVEKKLVTFEQVKTFLQKIKTSKAKQELVLEEQFDQLSMEIFQAPDREVDINSVMSLFE